MPPKLQLAVDLVTLLTYLARFAISKANWPRLAPLLRGPGASFETLHGKGRQDGAEHLSRRTATAESPGIGVIAIAALPFAIWPGAKQAWPGNASQPPPAAAVLPLA